MLKHNFTIVFVVVKLIDHSPNFKQKELILLCMVALGVCCCLWFLVICLILNFKKKIDSYKKENLKDSQGMYQAPG